jgi:hypothetical protein
VKDKKEEPELSLPELVKLAKLYDVDETIPYRRARDFWQYSELFRVKKLLEWGALLENGEPADILDDLDFPVVYPGENTIHKLSASYGRLWIYNDDTGKIEIHKWTIDNHPIGSFCSLETYARKLFEAVGQ